MKLNLYQIVNYYYDNYDKPDWCTDVGNITVFKRAVRRAQTKPQMQEHQVSSEPLRSVIKLEDVSLVASSFLSCVFSSFIQPSLQLCVRLCWSAPVCLTAYNTAVVEKS